MILQGQIYLWKMLKSRFSLKLYNTFSNERYGQLQYSVIFNNNTGIQRQ